MILGNIHQLQEKRIYTKAIQTALDYLSSQDFETMEVGKYSISC